MKNPMKTVVNLLLVGVVVLFPYAGGAAERITYYHLDALGSPVAASDETGNLLWREEYLPYGERRLNEPFADDNSRWYTGKPHDSVTGLSYFGARYYDPAVGRFMGVDPKGFDEANIQSFNRYAYGNNNPYRFVDPDGQAAQAVVGAVVGAVADIALQGILISTGVQESFSITQVAGATALGAASGGLGLGSKVKQLADAIRGVRGGGAVPKGPKVGGGGTLDKLSPTEIQRIQNAANRSGQEIGVVGSRVNPNKALRSDSDFDFVIGANSKTRNNLSRSLPGSKNVREGIPSNQDIFKGTVDPNKPHVIFRPE